MTLTQDLLIRPIKKNKKNKKKTQNTKHKTNPIYNQKKKKNLKAQTQRPVQGGSRQPGRAQINKVILSS